MATRILIVLASASGLVGLVYVLLSVFAAQVTENGVTRHIVAGGGVVRGALLLGVALLLAIIALVVRTA